MNNVILSIKPKYVEEIFNGNKLYEFRKVIWRKQPKKIYIYTSNPVQQIVGSFEIEEIINSRPEIVWSKTKDLAGMEASEFIKYFRSSYQAFAIKIKNLCEFYNPIEPRKMLKNFVPPQNFRYMTKEETEIINFCNPNKN